MINFAQLCYCIYYENYYNSFIMKNKKNNFYLMGVVFIAILGGLLFGYDTAVISGAEQALQKHLGLDAFWHGVTASSALIGCVIGSAFSGYFASGLGRRNSLRLAAFLYFTGKFQHFYKFRRIKRALAQVPVNKTSICLKHDFQEGSTRQIVYGIGSVSIKDLFQILNGPAIVSIHNIRASQHSGYGYSVCKIR